jgi:hypothetical protein
MARETLEDKAVRLISEGRLSVLRADDNNGLVVAACRGLSSGETHHLGFDPNGKNGHGEWRCTCEASRGFRRKCSHLMALQLVVSRRITRA